MKRLERILIVVGLLLLGVYGVSWAHREILSWASLRAFESAMTEVRRAENAAVAIPSPTVGAEGGGPVSASSPPAGPGPESAISGVDFSLWSGKRVSAYQTSLEKAVGVPLAVLRVPKIGLAAPVLEGTDDFSLNRGVGHIEGTPRPGEPGNVGIAGHRDGFFRGLKDVVPGDRIEVVSRQGTEAFAIDRITIVAPEDVSVLDPTAASTVTLVTCFPFYFVGDAPQRYIVRATRIVNESAR